MKPTPSRDDLEKQKLALEIGELQRAWWQRPVYLSILLPIVLGGLTFLAGVLSGFFDRERTHLKSEIEGLEREKSALLETQNTIRKANSDAEKRLKSLQKTNEEYEHQQKQLLELLQKITNYPVLQIGVQGLTPTPSPTSTPSN